METSLARSVEQPDPLMTVRQLADYLNVNERTVLKLVAEGALPGVKIGNQWRFRKAMIDTWLDDQMLGVTPRYVTAAEPDGLSQKRLDLASCFKPEHIVPELAAQTKNLVVEELAAKAHDLGLVRDKTWFMGALIERENVMPSAIGNGVAFLHTLRRNPEQVIRPFMIVGRSSQGVDFDALDSKPTHLFFVLGLKFEELYLPWLQKLSQMFAQPSAVKAVLSVTPEEIFQAIAEAERKLEPERLAKAAR
jgi:excisionase family DNA binding protein